MGLRQGGGFEPCLVLGDAPDYSGGIGVNGERKTRFKMQIALNGQTKWQGQRCNLRQADRTQFGTTEPQVGQTEEGVAIAIEFGKQPSGCAPRIEQFDNWHMVAAILAVGDQALFVGGSWSKFVRKPFQNISIWLRLLVSNRP